MKPLDPSSKRVKEFFKQDVIFTDEQVAALVRDRSIEDLALVTIVFQNEAFAVTFDPARASDLMLLLAAAFNRALSFDDRALFDACLAEIAEGYEAHDADVLDRLPEFRYVTDGDRVMVRVVFPDEEPGA